VNRRVPRNMSGVFGKERKGKKTYLSRGCTDRVPSGWYLSASFSKDSPEKTLNRDTIHSVPLFFTWSASLSPRNMGSPKISKTKNFAKLRAKSVCVLLIG
jgi:hypothetical protein